MTEVNIHSILSSIESSAEELNAVSDSANRLLAEVEERLVKYNIGFEIWFGPPLARSDSEGGVGARETSTEMVDLLGFAKAEGSWCLAVKRVRRVSGFFQGDLDSPYQNDYLEASALPLVKQSRDMRTSAAELLPRFLECVLKQVRGRTQQVSEATSRLSG